MLLLLVFLDNPFHEGFGGLRPVAMERTLEIIDQELRIAGQEQPLPCDAEGTRCRSRRDYGLAVELAESNLLEPIRAHPIPALARTRRGRGAGPSADSTAPAQIGAATLLRLEVRRPSPPRSCDAASGSSAARPLVGGGAELDQIEDAIAGLDCPVPPDRDGDGRGISAAITVAEACERAGARRIRLHDARHTAATLACCGRASMSRSCPSDSATPTWRSRCGSTSTSRRRTTGGLLTRSGGCSAVRDHALRRPGDHGGTTTGRK